MQDEFAKLLGPWPLLQIIFGLMVFGLGAYALFRGAQKNKEPPGLPPPLNLEDSRAQWEAYRQLENMESNSYKMLEQMTKITELNVRQNELLERIIESQTNMRIIVQQFLSAVWNKNQ